MDAYLLGRLVGFLLVAALMAGGAAALAVLVVRSNRRIASTWTEPMSHPAWHPDPYHPTQLRWFDGHQWTTATMPAATHPMR